ncbi:unnamed protein product [Nippostrongylus brasiliensis]|uniref:Uncharacterized GTP-binding protein (inferred by orthology to a C. elegans protein) n=1 Tax=Nippostrongylus brasiliensis TaxID=27835 RepID=A0A0N4YFZ3_NIPBR|nr:unnamed protein product [Nippostrongylus brasiliensis]
MSILQKIQDIEDEMARTQKNKATNAHLGMLKAKLAKLRQELITPKGGGGGGGEGFDVAKTGDARIGFVGDVVSILNKAMLCISDWDLAI